MQLRLASFVYNQRIISPHLSDAGHLHATPLIENQRMRLLSGLNELLFPPRCLGCGSLNEGLCHQCLLDWKISYLQTRVSAISVFSSILYTKTASNILLAAKKMEFEAQMIFLLKRCTIHWFVRLQLAIFLRY